MQQGTLTGRFVAYVLPASVALLWVLHVDPITVGGLSILLFVSILTHHAGVETWPTLLVCRFLSLPFVVWLGRLSYSTYLCHMFVLGPVVAIANGPLASLSGRARLAAHGLRFGANLAISAVLYYLIEKPGVGLGRQVSAWMVRRSAVRRPVPAIEPCQPRSE